MTDRKEELGLVKTELKTAWDEYRKDDPAAVGSTIIAMNRLVNLLLEDEK